MLWPLVRDGLTGQVDDVTLVDEMATEHAVLGPLVEAIEAALARGRSAPEAHADLAARLEQHLAHEEEAALSLIDRILTEEQWMSFGQSTTQRVGPGMPQVLPWLLDGTDAERTNAILGRLPEPVQRTCRNEWQATPCGTVSPAAAFNGTLRVGDRRRVLECYGRSARPTAPVTGRLTADTSPRVPGGLQRARPQTRRARQSTATMASMMIGTSSGDGPCPGADRA